MFDLFRPAIRAALVMGSLSVVACAPRDPVWDMPCADRPAREVEVGTGAEEIRSADGGLYIENGSQGGQHIWISVRMRGFGPEASLKYGIHDAEDPSIVYSGPLTEHVDLSYDPEAEASEALGLYGYLTTRYDPITQEPLPGPEGKSVVLWAEVSDACSPDAVLGEATGEVQ